ncbi:MAG: hypothetical protein WD314_01260 [Trueperaceae bacterium]
MRRPSQLRLAAFLAGLAAVSFALLASFVLYLLFGRQGRLGFHDFNLPGIAEGLLFVIALVSALRYLRSALRMPSPTLLSFGLVAPPPARKVAAAVPVVESAQNIQTLAENRIVVVEEQGVPVGVTGVKRERITSWEELVKIDGSVAVTDLRRVLAHEALVVVMEGESVAGVVTQEMYLGGLWGTVR